MMSFTLSAYRNVFIVFSQLLSVGEQHAIITVFESFMNESRKTKVSFDYLNGKCELSLSIARMHSFSASKLMFISAPSILVYLSVF